MTNFDVDSLPDLNNMDTKECEKGQEIIDLSSNNLMELPIMDLQNLQCLYLENNQIEALPDLLFEMAPNLKWLDVRSNLLTALPTSIKNHLSLETMLLQNNRITKLPISLCTVPTLKHLHLTGNPIIFPTMEVIKCGAEYILKFLKFYYDRPDYQQHMDGFDTQFDGAEQGSISDNNESGEITKRTYHSQESEMNKQNYEFGNERELSKSFSEKTYNSNFNRVNTRYQNNTFKKTDYLIDTEKIPENQQSTREKSVLFKHFNSNKYVKRVKVLNKNEQALKVMETALEEKALEKKRELLLKRQKVLEDRKSLEALKNWRDIYKESKNNAAPVYYSLDLNQLPYDTDHQHMKILTREEIERDLPDKYKKQLKPKLKQRNTYVLEKIPIETKITETKDFMDTIKIQNLQNSPRTQWETASDDIKKLTELKKKIVRLKLENDGS